MNGIRTLSINNPHGSLTISGNSPDGQLHLTVDRHVYSLGRTDVQERLDTLVPNVQSNAGILSVTLPDQLDSRSDLTLQTPAQTALNVSRCDGTVDVTGVAGPTSITSSHGDVSLKQIAGAQVQTGDKDSSVTVWHSLSPVSIIGEAGDIDIRDVSTGVSLKGKFYGTTHLEQIGHSLSFETRRTTLRVGELPGSLEITSGRVLSGSGLNGPTVLDTRDRYITLHAVSGSTRITNQHGKVELSVVGSSQPVTVHDREGSIDLLLPRVNGYHLQASTRDGQIQIEPSMPIQRTGDSSTLTATVEVVGSLSFCRLQMGTSPSGAPTP